MKAKHLYFLLFIFGTIIPLSHFVGYLQAYGPDFYSFFDLMFANRIAAFFAWDVVISAVVVLLFIIVENSREHVRYYSLAVVLLLIAGVSSGLPLFLYLRENNR